MDLALLVYGISVIGSIGPVLGMTVGLTITALTISLIYRFAALSIESWDSENTKKRKLDDRVPLEKWIKRLFGILGLTVFLIVTIPSEKTAYMMVGAYAAQKIAENDKVQETGQKVLTIINHKLDSYVDESLKTIEDKSKGKKKGKNDE